MEYVKELVGKEVVVITLEGRCLVGTLKGYDNSCNLILGNAHERIFSEDRGMERDPLGLYVVRGDSVGVVGEMDEEVDAGIDWEKQTGEAPRPIVHGVAQG